MGEESIESRDTKGRELFTRVRGEKRQKNRLGECRVQGHFIFLNF